MWKVLLSSVLDTAWNPAATTDRMTAQIGQLALTKPAPAFKGTAVVDGLFKEIKLADYKGKYLVFFFYPLDL